MPEKGWSSLLRYEQVACCELAVSGNHDLESLEERKEVLCWHFRVDHSDGDWVNSGFDSARELLHVWPGNVGLHRYGLIGLAKQSRGRVHLNSDQDLVVRDQVFQSKMVAKVIRVGVVRSRSAREIVVLGGCRKKFVQDRLPVENGSMPALPRGRRALADFQLAGAFPRT